MADYDGMIRIFMFSITGLIGGVAALIWAGWTRHQYVRSGGKDSVFILILLTINALDLLVLCTLPFLHSLTIMVCVALRMLSLYFHQWVALEGVASVTHPRFAAVLSSVRCSVTLTLSTFILVIIITVILLFFDPELISFFIVTAVAPVLIHVVMCILICTKAKPHQASRGAITEKTVLVESLVSYLVLHGPCLLAVAMYLLYDVMNLSLRWFLVGYDAVLPTMCFSIGSLWVMADCLLCVIVCRLPRV